MGNIRKVFKFGGASIKDATHIKNVVNVLQNYKGEELVIVVSAIGNTTDQLEAIAKSHAKQDGKALELLESIKSDHYLLVQALFEQPESIFMELNDTFVEIEWVLEEEPHENFDYSYDQIVSVGELLSSKILAALLNQTGLPTIWLDARDVILTDNIYREGWVQWAETIDRCQEHLAPLVTKDQFVLTQGFIASTSENFTTTLGREGSDYTAAILSFCLDASQMVIWKDVPGVLSGDPRIFDKVTKIEKLSYREAIELTYYGSKVIHPKTIKPLQNKSIPLYVRPYNDPQSSGTYIGEVVNEDYPPIVALEQNQALLHISTKDFSFVAEHHLSHIYQTIAGLRLQVNMMQNAAISFSVCFNDTDDKVDRFIEEISNDFEVTINRGLELITVRHYEESILDDLKEGKIVLLEVKHGQTLQMVVKPIALTTSKGKVDSGYNLDKQTV